MAFQTALESFNGACMCVCVRVGVGVVTTKRDLYHMKRDLQRDLYPMKRDLRKRHVNSSIALQTALESFNGACMCMCMCVCVWLPLKETYIV